MKKAGLPRATKRKSLPARFKRQRFLSIGEADENKARLGVKKFCASYGVTQETFTRLSGFSQRAVAHWAQGRAPSASTGRRLTELDRMFGKLEKLVGKDAMGVWLKEPNEAFDGSTPLQVIERGESDRIWHMIYELESGEPG